MRIESFKINKQYRGITLEGTCRVIPPSTYMITMEKPYKGLSKAEYFRNNSGCYSIENIKGRAQWELGRLYEQFQSILYGYDKYKKLLDEWMPYQQKLQRLKEEVAPFRQGADAENLAALTVRATLSSPFPSTLSPESFLTAFARPFSMTKP